MMAPISTRWRRCGPTRMSSDISADRRRAVRKAGSRLLRYRGLWPVLGHGYWAIRERETGRFAGDVGFADFERVTDPPVRGLPEAGWVLARWAHGRGFASEALQAALAWLDRNTVHERAVCLVGGDNAASIRVAEKNGFRRNGPVGGWPGTTHLMIRTG